MIQILNMAIKDLKILMRDRLGAFFIIGFPIIMGLFFGMIMGGNSGGNRAKMKIAIVDNDQSEMSKTFVELLANNESVKLEADEFESARKSVQGGSRVGMLVLPEKFGETVGVFWADSPAIELGMDPSRMAEAGMVQGFVMQAVGEMAGIRMTDPASMKSMINDSKKQLDEDPEVDVVTRGLLGAFFNSLDGMFDNVDQLQQQPDSENSPIGENGFQFANIKSLDITEQPQPGSIKEQMGKIHSPWDISFPQAMLWGVLGCVAGFSISIARERTMGTMVRLQAAPINRFQILAGKALSCFLTVLFVVAMLTLLGMLLPNGLRPNNYIKLIVATLAVAFCFTGIMMMFSVLGKTEQSVSGIGWATNMIMAMLGGCMIPVMFMPAFIQQASVISPVKWAILSIEGAIWRQFSYAEMLLPCSILISVGTVGLVVGTLLLSRQSA